MSDAMYAAASLYNDPRFFSKSEVRIRNNRRRRQRIVRRQFSMLLIAITIIIFLAVFFTSTLMSDAKSDTYEPEFKYFTTITVHSGDTLLSIADDYYSPDHYVNIKSYISEICNLNGIERADLIKAGENLIIPYFSKDYR